MDPAGPPAPTGSRGAEPGDRLPVVPAVPVVVAVEVSAIRPESHGTRLPEVRADPRRAAPARPDRRRFPPATLARRPISGQAPVPALGAHCTYAGAPPGDLWTDRNHHDRFARFVQGFVPAVPVREIRSRRTPLRP